MEALPVIAETGQALGLPLAVTLALIIVSTSIFVVVALHDHRNRIDNARDEVNSVKSGVDKQISEIKDTTEKEIAEVKGSMKKAVSEIKAEMGKQAAYHNSELNALYKLVNGVAVDVSFIKGKMTRGTK